MNGGVELLRKGIVDDADERFELVGKGERDGHVGEGVNEVGGAVDGIDYESWRGRQTRRGCGRLFAQEANRHGSVISIQGFGSCYPVRVVRISGCEGPGHHILDGFISLSDKIRSYVWLFSRVSARCATKNPPDARRLRNVQFTFVSTVAGLAEMIIPPAFWAKPMRKSWISSRLGSVIFALTYVICQTVNVVDSLINN